MVGQDCHLLRHGGSPDIDLAFILHYGWAGLSFAPAGDSHTGVAVGTHVYPRVTCILGSAGHLAGTEGAQDAPLYRICSEGRFSGI